MARRLASDRERLNRYADEMDARAVSLEAEVAILKPISPKGLCQTAAGKQQSTTSFDEPLISP
jgi:hypothetical protein